MPAVDLRPLHAALLHGRVDVADEGVGSLDKMDSRFDRLEAKVDGLILGLARNGYLTDPEVPSGVDD